MSVSDSLRDAAAGARDRAETAVETAEGVMDHQVDEMRRDDRGIIDSIRLVAGGLIMVLVLALVLTEVHQAVEFETDADGNYTGPFGGVVDTLEGTGVAALTLLVVGFLVVAAGAIMRFFGAGFSGGR